MVWGPAASCAPSDGATMSDLHSTDWSEYVWFGSSTRGDR